MGMLLAFAPFIAFAVIDRLATPLPALVVAALISLALIIRDVVMPQRSPKALEIGTAILFAGLAIYTLAAEPHWSVIAVRLCVDAGLLIVILITMAIGRPFTLQYAREQVPAEFHNSPEFTRTNYVITGVWALAFAVMVAAEAAILYVPNLPPRFGVIVIVAAIVGAMKFTGWYPDRVKTQV
jgi:hypothetical protein